MADYSYFGSTKNKHRIKLVDANGDGVITATNLTAGLKIDVADDVGNSTIYSGANIEAVATPGVYSTPTTASDIRFGPVSGGIGIYELQTRDELYEATGTDGNAKQLTISTYGISGVKDNDLKVILDADNRYLPLTEVVTVGDISLKRITAYGLSNVVRAPSDIWQWSSSTAVSDPSFFRVKLNNADYNLATIMSIHQDSETGISNEYIFGAIEINDVINLFNQTTMESKRLRVNGTPTDNGSWWEFPVISADNGFSGPWSTESISYIVVSFENVILTHLETMDAKLGTADDLGTGATLFANTRDLAGTTFDNTTNSLEDIIDTGGPGPWTTGGGAGGGDATLANQELILANQQTVIGKLASEQVVVKSSRPQAGLYEVIRGVDHTLTSESGPLELPVDPSITINGVTIFTVKDYQGNEVINVTASLQDAGLESQRLIAEVAASDTVNLALGATYEYVWTNTDDGGEVWKPEYGVFDIAGDVPT